MTDSDKQALHRKIAAMLGYEVREESGVWNVYRNGDLQLPKGWHSEDGAWLHGVPQWASDLNAAFSLLPNGVSVEFVAYHGGRYELLIDGDFYTEFVYDRADLAYGLCETWLAWKAAQSQTP